MPEGPTKKVIYTKIIALIENSGWCVIDDRRQF
jgi:hypothetical protein